jgi:hypothetical protein
LNQPQSRRALIGVGLLAALLMAAPYLLRAWNAGHETDDKVLVFEGVTARPSEDLLGCLLHRASGGLALTISSENHYADAARGLVVRIEPRGDGHALEAWLDKGAALTAGEADQLKVCAAAP